MADRENIVRKVISAGNDLGFVGGEAYSDHLNLRATYSQDSIAVDPFRSPGRITSGFGLAGSSWPGLTQHLTAMKRWLPTTRQGFGLDRKGNVAIMDVVNNNASYLRALTASAITNEDVGLEIHNDALYVAYNLNASIAYLSQLNGISNLPTATWNISFNVSMLSKALNSDLNGSADSQVKHPLISWQGRLYALNGNRVDYTTGPTGILTAGCQLPTNMVLKTGIPFGNQLVLGASSNLIDPTYIGGPRVYFYDGISAQWDKDVEFPDTDITNLEVFSGTLIGFGPNGFYEYDGSGFKKIDSLDQSVPHRGTDVFDGRLWFKGNNVLRGFGKPSLQLADNAMIRPTTGDGGNVQGIVRWITPNKVLVTANESALIYRHQSSAFETSAKYISRYFNIDGAEFYVRAVTVGYDPLTSGDGCDVIIYDDQGTATTIGSVSYSADATNNPVSKDFIEKDYANGLNKMRMGRASISFTAGRMAIRYIELVLEVVPTI